MELGKIQKLLTRYFEGETTLSEEKKLQKYFSQKDIHPSVQQHTYLFKYFKNQRQQTTKTVLFKKPKLKTERQWIGIAASIALIAGLFIGAQFLKDKKTEDLGTYEDPEIALAKTKEALQMISYYMNEGTEDLKYLHEIEKTTKQILK